MRLFTIGRAKWKPLELPFPTESVTQNQYCILREIKEICSTNKDLKNARVVIPTTSSSSLPLWTMQMTDGFWKMTVDCHKFNQAMGDITLVHHVDDIMLLGSIEQNETLS